MYRRERVKDKSFWTGTSLSVRTFVLLILSEGLRIFLKTLRDVEKESGVRPAIILEATGHYHLPLVKFAEENSYLLIVLNPRRKERRNLIYVR